LKLALTAAISGETPAAVAPALEKAGGVVQKALEIVSTTK
jgi:hypothetical protein